MADPPDFKPPSWASAPVATVRLDQGPHTTFGRAQDAVDVHVDDRRVTEAVSRRVCRTLRVSIGPRSIPDLLPHLLRSAASRLHAAVVHHPSGKVYLIDLGSTRGTQVDALKLDKHRPLQLKDGFALRFGCDLASWVYTVRIDARCVCRPA